MSDLNINQSIPRNDEINLLEVAQKIWAGRKTILFTTIIFVVLAGSYIFYKKLTLIPEYVSHVTSYTDLPTPEIVITLITGAPFLKEVLAINLINSKTHQTETVMKILDKYTRPPQGNLGGLIGRVSAIQGKTGTLEISVQMQDAHLASQLADSIAQKLALFLHTFQSQRTQKNLQYLINRYHEAESAYQKSLNILSDYYRSNSHKLHSLDTIIVKRLRAESDLKYDVYCELALELEKARIKEQEQVPIYNILEHATPATQNNVPKTGRTIFFMFFLGLLAGGCLVYVKGLYNKITTKSV